MAPKLTVQNAEIKTAAVEIQTLTISGKQVTLAVFRQLPEEPLVAGDCTLNGEPWGVVNYHPDKCGDSDEHIHVVWQRGSKLLRCRVNVAWNADLPCGAAMEFLEAAIHEGLRMKEHFPGIRDVRIGVAPSYQQASGVPASFIYGGVRFRGQITPSAARIWASGFRDTHGNDAETLAGEYADRGRTSEELAVLVPAGEYHGLWRLLNDLPQLFIAV